MCDCVVVFPSQSFPVCIFSECPGELLADPALQPADPSHKPAVFKGRTEPQIAWADCLSITGYYISFAHLCLEPNYLCGNTGIQPWAGKSCCLWHWELMVKHPGWWRFALHFQAEFVWLQLHSSVFAVTFSSLPVPLQPLFSPWTKVHKDCCKVSSYYPL